jgi:c-di-GMP-related signal transduction protein
LKKEAVEHPDHYGGQDNQYEAIKVIEAWDLNFSLGNVLKYINRSGKKSDNPLEDLQKAAQYLGFEIARLERRRQ